MFDDVVDLLGPGEFTRMFESYRQVEHNRFHRRMFPAYRCAEKTMRTGDVEEAKGPRSYRHSIRDDRCTVARNLHHAALVIGPGIGIVEGLMKIDTAPGPQQ